MYNDIKKIYAQMSFGKDFSAELIIEDEYGKEECRRPMHSFTKNFLENIRRMLFCTDSATTQDLRKVIDSEGNLIPVNSTYDRLFYEPTGHTSSLHGIILGVGSPDRSIDMIAMGQPLTSSSLQYITPPGYAISSSHNSTDGGRIVISKSYKNITDSDINITQIGFTHYHGAASYALFSHDVYDPPIPLELQKIKNFYIQINISPTLPKQFFDLVCVMFNDNSLSSKSTNASTITISVLNYGMALTGFGGTTSGFNAINTARLGLFIGSNSTPVSASDYAITSVGSRVDNTALPTVSILDDQAYLQFVSTFWNPSQYTPIDVNQIGLYCGRDLTSIRLMIFRYVLPEKITLTPLQYVEVHFKIKITFS